MPAAVAVSPVASVLSPQASQGPYADFFRMDPVGRQRHWAQLSRERRLRAFKRGYEAWKKKLGHQALLRVLLGDLSDAGLLAAWGRMNPADNAAMQDPAVGRAIGEVRERVQRASAPVLREPDLSKYDQPLLGGGLSARVEPYLKPSGPFPVRLLLAYLRMSIEEREFYLRSNAHTQRDRDLPKTYAQWLERIPGRLRLELMFGDHGDEQTLAAWNAMPERWRIQRKHELWARMYPRRQPNAIDELGSAIAKAADERRQRDFFDGKRDGLTASLPSRAYPHALSWLAFNPQSATFDYLNNVTSDNGVRLPTTIVDVQGLVVPLLDGTLHREPFGDSVLGAGFDDDDRPAYLKEADLRVERQKRSETMRWSEPRGHNWGEPPFDSLGLASVFADPERWPWHVVNAKQLRPKVAALRAVGTVAWPELPQELVASCEVTVPNQRTIRMMPRTWLQRMDASTRPEARDPVGWIRCTRLDTEHYAFRTERNEYVRGFVDDERVRLEFFDRWGVLRDPIETTGGTFKHSQLGELLSVKSIATAGVGGFCAVLEGRYLLYTSEREPWSLLRGELAGAPGRINFDIFDLEAGKMCSVAPRVERPSLDPSAFEAMLLGDRMGYPDALRFVVHCATPAGDLTVQVRVKKTTDAEGVKIVVTTGDLLDVGHAREEFGLGLLSMPAAWRRPLPLRSDDSGAWFVVPSVQRLPDGRLQATHSLFFFSYSSE